MSRNLPSWCCAILCLAIKHICTSSALTVTVRTSQSAPSALLLRPMMEFQGRFPTKLSLSAQDDEEFWNQQKALMDQMTGRVEKSMKQEQLEKFRNRRKALLGDTALFTALVSSILWAVAANPFVSFSFIFGSTFGIAYAYGLGKYVESLGGSIDEAESAGGAGVGQARFAFLILLFIFVGKFKSSGLLEIPSIAGFFTYQLASLSQGLREIND